MKAQEEESFRENVFFREYINDQAQNVGRNMNGKGHSDEVLDGNEGQLT